VNNDNSSRAEERTQRAGAKRSLAAAMCFALMGSVASANAQTCPARPGVPNAFQGIVIAVAGWRGECRDTFGTDQHNLLEIIADKGTYDVDCFEYDEQQLSISDASRALNERIRGFHTKGYKQVAFITHSTGGVVALEAILQEADALGKDSMYFRADGIVLRGVYAWAAPMNGMAFIFEPLARIYVAIASWIKDRIGIEDKIVGDLIRDSEYLTGFQQRLKTFFKSPFRPGGPNHNYRIEFLQGNGEDGIVLPISKSDEWWPKDLGYHVLLTDTDTRHSYNISKGGSIGTPRLAGSFSQNAMQLAIIPQPRYSDYFSAGTPQTCTSVQGRRRVVNGLEAFTSSPTVVASAVDAVSELLGRLATEPFARDDAEDKQLIEVVLSLFGSVLGAEPGDEELRVAKSLLDELLAYAKNAKERVEGLTPAGLPALACGIRDTVSGYIEHMKAGNSEAAAELRTKLDEVIGALYRRAPNDDAIAKCALSATLVYVREASSEEIKSSKSVASAFELSRFNPARVGQHVQDYAELLENLASREDNETKALAASYAQFAPETGPLAGSPLWARVFAKDQAGSGEMFAKLILDPLNAQPDRNELVLRMFRNGGPLGNQPDFMRGVGTDFRDAIAAAPEGVRDGFAQDVINGMKGSPYPNIELRALNDIRSIPDLSQQ
jgi:hypothetical protein